MHTTFFFYDLETSGFSARADRIMQFGGQRIDMDLNPVGEPVNILIKLSEDILPGPDAILVTGITPQQTIADGITEREFTKIFNDEVATPGTIFVGFNSIRFDDEFMRFLQYRNFYDAYEWQWKDGRGKWDLLDVVRMTRALRPEGIKWPVDSAGKSANRLEMLASINNLDHTNAHDALSDVMATIDLARLIKTKQPKLFDFLLSMRDKSKITGLINKPEAFVYSSGKYPAEFEKTTVVVKIADHPKRGGALVYDLRHDPEPFMKMTPEQLVDAWRYKKVTDKNADDPRLPVKTLQFNHCPAIAPLAVLDDASKKRLQLDIQTLNNNLAKLRSNQQFVVNVLKALEIMDKKQQASFLQDEKSVDAQLYDGFFGDTDKTAMIAVRAAGADELSDLVESCKDSRLKALLPLYKARNFPKSLNDDERAAWEKFVQSKLFEGNEPAIKKYFARLEELTQQTTLTKNQQYLLEELKLYGESLMQ